MEPQNSLEFESNLSIHDLPLEILVDVLGRLDVCTLATCRVVCKKWKEIINGTDLLWQKNCERDFKFSSIIAKRKAGHECQWYDIYRNLTMWSNVTYVEKKLRTFYMCSDIYDRKHALDIDCNILPVKDKQGYMLYEVSTLQKLTYVIPDKSCSKLSNNDQATAILTETGLYFERTPDKPGYETSGFFKADAFYLTKDRIYYTNDRELYKCNLLQKKILAEHILHCDYDLRDVIQVYNNNIYLFSACGKLITVSSDYQVSVKTIDLPIEWIKQIKDVCVLNDKNFACFSTHLFKVETDKCQHLYLDFPPVTALFFYGDLVILGTRDSEILLYHLSNQKWPTRPTFEKLAVLPEKQFAVHLDVCERKAGPIIIIASFSEIMLLELTFFPHEQESEIIFPPHKLHMRKRLLRLRDRLQGGNI